jgi:hypothetical protein
MLKVSIDASKLSNSANELKSLSAPQMQQELSSALDEGRRHLVTVHQEKDGRLGIEFDPELGDVERAFTEASEGTPTNRPS